MRKIISIFLFILALFGCRDIQCPAFPENLLAYFPYEKGDLLKFTNLSNDTLSFTIKDSWASGPSSYSWNCKCSCGSDAGFETETNDKYALRIDSRIIILTDPDLANIVFGFYDSELSSVLFTLEVKGNPYSDENKYFFGDSIIIDNEENERISKIKIVEGKGIVEFFDKKENCNWIRIE